MFLKKELKGHLTTIQTINENITLTVSQDCNEMDKTLEKLTQFVRNEESITKERMLASLKDNSDLESVKVSDTVNQVK